MEVIKKKMRLLKATLEDAESRARRAEERLAETNQKCEDAEEDVKNQCEIIDKMEEDLDEKESRLNTMLTTSVYAEIKGDENERQRQLLEARTKIDEEKFQRLSREHEEILSKNEATVAELEKEGEEVTVYEDQFEVVDDKSLTLDVKNKQLERDITLVGNNLRTMEISETKGSEREGYQNGKLETLQSKFTEASQSAEMNEAKCSELENRLTELEENLESAKKGFKRFYRDYEHSVNEMVEM